MAPALDDDAPSASAPLPRNVKVLGFSSLLNDIATEMAFPIMPAFLAKLAPGETWLLGLVEGIADTVAAVLKLFSGRWSDRLGNRRGFVIFGYALAAVTRPLIGFATSVWHVAAARTTDRVGKGLRATPRDALIVDSMHSSQRGRAFGFNRAMDHLGAAIGPLLTFAFLWFFPGRLNEVFWLTLVPGLFVIALVTWGVKNPPQLTPAGKQLRLTLQPFEAGFKRYLLALVCFTLGNSSDMLLLGRARELGMEASIALLWCAFHVVKSIGNYVCGSLVDRRGPFGMLLGGWSLYGLIYAGFALAGEIWQIWALFGVYAIFYAVTEPAEKTLAAQLAGPEHKGVAFGWFNFTVGIGALPANLLTAWLYKVAGPVAAFGACALFAAVAAAVLTTVRPGTSPTKS